MGTLIQSTDTNYESGMDSIRKRVSPFAVSPITAAQLPNDFINDPIYVNPAEARVIADKETTVAAVVAMDRTSAAFQELQLLVWIRIAIEFISQNPQLLNDVVAVVQQRYAEINWKDRVKALEETYQTRTGCFDRLQYR